ncbi:transcriptional regulator [Brenneria goodwinii]|uniref:Transcriptional regulator n=2 Tax=Brenneria goodwinii TaxID=1109412 RepID=A0AAE8ENY0_9GAMM|nr:helix-turn-helix transcriptional regulator [Brenneria goodwinii]ATA23105.1 DNA-binding protein [Brenneria goodwinii]MCG8158845.1 helix-turn-helix transcriptional regulator [Brenneria goodwinii]MCG8163436.1 helix-turn-helix transcriptional regulator [Brenneria goodwinii]MCG8167974.1 helix-turn-helix transcriptional regulator [Brenneria goodwinii]MCG8172627.1 helix-turn-helix transcriptional regulator [Brenneria goodwinii]
MRFNTMSEGEIITELCRRIKDARIQQRLSQVDLAERAGLGIATIKRAEMGESITLSSLLCILRGLNRLHQLEGILFDAEVESFNAQVSGEKKHTPLRIRKKAVASPAKTTSKHEKIKEKPASTVDWYISAAENNIVWSLPDNGKK